MFLFISSHLLAKDGERGHTTQEILMQKSAPILEFMRKPKSSRVMYIIKVLDKYYQESTVIAHCMNPGFTAHSNYWYFDCKHLTAWFGESKKGSVSKDLLHRSLFNLHNIRHKLPAHFWVKGAEEEYKIGLKYFAGQYPMLRPLQIL